MRVGVGVVAVLLLVGGCSGGGDDPDKPAAATVSEPAAVVVKGTFTAASAAPPGTTAFLYDPSAVKGPASAVLTLREDAGHTKVALAVDGFMPNRSFGAHLHAKPCGPAPDDAGGHFQHQPDPAPSPSGDPQYANPNNEIWLDFTTNDQGHGQATAEQDWELTPGHRPASLVVHATATMTSPGVAGTAGPRVACMTITY
ncbi:superoxide dismutase family protein [Dactylosporangium sp. AC04546]|uniref:superoxide dismutase family protein n=1 Tax=Dactylosporangium sp. AC04546 TaxID=2862460 RepID=UPI001EDDA48F|nr:superoxide dismutase family protein [Dactylosporangium sp. AC04546]WVK87907.1 superoxide dismutase family protein [Dactylosporangium sp. AC04546]